MQAYIYLRVGNLIKSEKYVEDKTLIKIMQTLLIILEDNISKTKKTINTDLNR